MERKSLLDCFGDVNDPRIDRAKKHKLIDILAIAICAVISGAEGWEHMELFAKIKEDWLRRFLELPNGIPSHDTIARVFSVIDPEQFQNAFIAWINGIELQTDGKVVAIDGKSIRRSFDNAHGKKPLHMVSAWASEAGIALGQIKTDEKSNEITVIPKLLEMLDLAGAIVTIDAMGCQKNIATCIRAKGANYVLALKQNHSNLFHEVSALFRVAKQNDFKDMPHGTATSTDQNHGRLETRTCFCLSAQQWFPSLKDWDGLSTLVMIESSRESGGVVQSEARYYLSSLPMDAKQLLSAVRSHWGIENSLHWVLDMTFREDESRIRKDHAPENLAAIRKVVLNMLKLNKPKGLSFKKAKLMASWDTDFALKTVFGG